MTKEELVIDLMRHRDTNPGGPDYHRRCQWVLAARRLVEPEEAKTTAKTADGFSEGGAMWHEHEERIAALEEADRERMTEVRIAALEERAKNQHELNAGLLTGGVETEDRLAALEAKAPDSEWIASHEMMARAIQEMRVRVEGVRGLQNECTKRIHKLEEAAPLRWRLERLVQDIPPRELQNEWTKRIAALEATLYGSEDDIGLVAKVRAVREMGDHSETPKGSPTPTAGDPGVLVRALEYFARCSYQRAKDALREYRGEGA